MKTLLTLLLLIPSMSWGYTTLKCVMENTSANYFIQFDTEGKKPLLVGSKLGNLKNIDDELKKKGSDCLRNMTIDDNFITFHSLCFGENTESIDKLNRFTLEFDFSEYVLDSGDELRSRKDKCELIEPKI
jgi:hypothetical protein